MDCKWQMPLKLYFVCAIWGWILLYLFENYFLLKPLRPDCKITS